MLVRLQAGQANPLGNGGDSKGGSAMMPAARPRGSASHIGSGDQIVRVAEVMAVTKRKTRMYPKRNPSMRYPPYLTPRPASKRPN